MILDLVGKYFYLFMKDGVSRYEMRNNGTTYTVSKPLKIKNIKLTKTFREGNLEYLVDSEGMLSGCNIQKKNYFWHTVPRSVIYRYTADANAVKKAKELSRKGSRASSLYYRYDLRFNPKRAFFVNVHNFRYFKKYRLYKV